MPKRLAAGLTIALAVSGAPAQPRPTTIVPATKDEIPRVEGTLIVEPMSFSRKTQYYAKASFSPVSLLLPALPAAIVMADPPNHYPREWRNGGAAFGRNFGDALATEIAADTGKYLAGAIAGEDPRYYPDQSHNPVHRAWHAIVFTVIDRDDSGHKMIAVSNFAGAASAGFVGVAYLPEGYNDLTHAGQRAGGTLGGYTPILLVGYATQNLLSEYTPELKRVAQKLHLPFVPKE